MSSYPVVYIKDPYQRLPRKRRWQIGVLSLVGILFLTWSWGPIVSYQFFAWRDLELRSFLSPVAAQDSQFSPPQINSELLNPDDWFPDYPLSAKTVDLASQPAVSEYRLSIPSLGIQQAVVRVNETDLSQSLIQYGSQTMPGDVGNTVILGHSSLPQFFNPRNYKTIFSVLPQVRLGEVVVIEIDGLKYVYQIIDKYEVKPSEVSVLDQDYNQEMLTLITCTPPGTYLRRLIVQAKLIPYEE